MEIEPGISGEPRNDVIKSNQEVAKSRWNRPVVPVFKSWFPTLPRNHHFLVTKAVTVPHSVINFKCLPSQLHYRFTVCSIIPALLDIEKLCLADHYRVVTKHIKECRVLRSIHYQHQKDWAYRLSIHMMQDYLLKMSKRCWRIFVEQVYTGHEDDDFYDRGVNLATHVNRNIATRVLRKTTFFDYPALHMFLFWTKDLLAADMEAVAKASYFFHEGMRFLVDLERHMLERIVRVRQKKANCRDKKTAVSKTWLVCGDVIQPATIVRCHSRLMFVYSKYYCKECDNFPISGEFYNWHRLLYHTGSDNLLQMMSQKTLDMLQTTAIQYLEAEVDGNNHESHSDFRRGCV